MQTLTIRSIEAKSHPQTKGLFWYLFVGTRGGHNRVRIISQLRNKPSNKNQLAQDLGIDSNKVGGVMFCPYDMRKISNFNLINMFEIFEKHERTFVLKNNEINELNVNKINCAKLFL